MRFTRVTLFFIAFIITLGFYQLTRHFLADVEPQIFQATEEVLVDIAHLLAESVEKDVARGELRADDLRETFSEAHKRRFKAEIFEHVKSRIGINVYLTDREGMVIFDSDGGKREGQDFSSKRDVALTMAGSYGARSSRDDDKDPTSSILYVAAPVGDPESPHGVLTVFKPQADVLPLVKERRRIIYTACGLIGGGVLFLIGAVFLWLFHPIGKITDYANAVERGERPMKPKIGIGREVNTLAKALDSMRDALEGRQYAERYIQTLTHEMKSPLAAIRGAAELLDEEMPPETRQRFLNNIIEETARSERLINRLLELSAIESRTSLEKPEDLDFNTILQAAIDQAKAHAEIARVSLDITMPDQPVRIRGDAFILRAAILNLLENAIDFSPKGSSIRIDLQAVEGLVTLSIRDHGPGIPDYARERIFDRFYSLRHHTVGRKGTGLGLTLVKEAAELHGGTIRLEAPEDGGTLAILTLAAS
ncbi:two-component system sensor histidine kinase CreC [Luteolibacter sp. SL250]|uniref:two-component system sensor histidine kinase CreC n=1 Tax=Luteolibacter sp. SL250 TaxID=2995170 RepID=UPI00226DBD90|nr:two-component system sensor histidine kinase CreC [Luteolibacter sp. SL250]WAC19390.1 two-component system sensor histidine kinase CreC [Luteolibacter sp. SL250]